MPNEYIHVDGMYVYEARKQKRQWTSIATDLGISESKLRTWRKEVEFEEPLVVPDDEELRDFVRNYTQEYKDQGQTQIESAVANNGWDVKRDELRNVIHEVDPEGNRHRTLKRHKPIVRTEYDVVNPNDLWHGDQNEKLLKKGGIFIFGWVDGGTRRIVNMYVADNKRPYAVIDGFIKAVNDFGCPRRLRTDQGSENTCLWDLMARLRGDDSVLRGPSPHNIKIEHQWYFTRWNVLNAYRAAYDIFTVENEYMPQNSENQTSVEKFLYKYLVMTRLQQDLDYYRDVWNGHKSRAFQPPATPAEIAMVRCDDAVPDMSDENKNKALQDWKDEDVPGYEARFGIDEYEAIRHPDRNVIIRPLYDIPFCTTSEMEFFETYVKPLTLENDLYNDLQERWTLALQVLDHIEQHRQEPDNANDGEA
jgi:hypothetical protein